MPCSRQTDPDQAHLLSEPQNEPEVVRATCTPSCAGIFPCRARQARSHALPPCPHCLANGVVRNVPAETGLLSSAGLYVRYCTSRTAITVLAAALGPGCPAFSSHRLCPGILSAQKYPWCPRQKLPDACRLTDGTVRSTYLAHQAPDGIGLLLFTNEWSQHVACPLRSSFRANDVADHHPFSRELPNPDSVSQPRARRDHEQVRLPGSSEAVTTTTYENSAGYPVVCLALFVLGSWDIAKLLLQDRVACLLPGTMYILTPHLH